MALVNTYLLLFNFAGLSDLLDMPKPTQNQADTGNLKADNELETALSTSDGELEKRISALVATFPSRVEAAKVAGVSTEQLRRYQMGASPRLEPVARLCEAAGWSIDFIWSGRQPSLSIGEPTAEMSEETFVQVPQYDVEVAAGDGRVPGAEEVLAYYAFRRDWIRHKGWNPAKLAIVICRGDSQEGLIDDGQPVLVDLADHDVFIEGLFVLRLDDHLLIKTVQMDWQGNALLRSNNPRYREIAVPKAEISQLQVVGRAIWTDHVL